MYLCPMIENKIEPDYIPGTCNIGKEEIARRYRIGFIGVFLTIILVVLIELMDVHRLWRLAVIAPVAFSLTGFVQAKQRFCLAYGFSGVFSIKGMRQLTKVRDDTFLKQDRQMAMILVARVAIGTGIITMLYYILPWS